MAQTVVPQVPVWAYEMWVARGVDWLAMTEDLPRLENRVTIEPSGEIRLHYTPNNLSAHDALVDETKRMLRKLGFWIVVSHSHKAKNTTHQCGTLVFGTDPARIGARHLLPHPRHRQPVRRRRVVLPLVGGRQSRPDDRRAGDPVRGSHQGTD